MTVAETSRLKLTTWSVDEDPVSRLQFTTSHENLELYGAKFTTGASNPATPDSEYARSFFYNTSTNTLHFSQDGSSWLTVGVGTDFVRTGSTQTLTNKTLTAPVIATISNTGTLTLPTATDTLVGRSTTDTLTNKTLSDAIIDYGVLKAPEEVWSVNASAPASSQSIYLQTSSAWLFTSNATTNVSLNITGTSGGTTINSLISTNTSITCAVAITNGSTPYYLTGITIDGNAQTVKWQGGNSPSGGNANAIDVYTFTIIKTGSAAFTVLGAQTKFA